MTFDGDMSELFSENSTFLSNETFSGTEVVDPFFFLNTNLTSEQLQSLALYNETSNETVADRSLKIYTRPPWLSKSIETSEKIKTELEKYSNSSDQLLIHRILLLPRFKVLRDSPLEQENLELLKKPEQKVTKDEIFRSRTFNSVSANETGLEVKSSDNSSLLLLVLSNSFQNESLPLTNDSISNETNLQIGSATDLANVTSKPLFVRHRWVYVNATLLAKENLTCTVEYQKIIDSKYGGLLSEIRDKSRSSSLSFPLAFSFSNANLKARCDTYQNATADIPAKVKKACATNYEVYDQVQNVYAYPCGWGSETYFFYYFDCLSQARTDDLVKQCEFDSNEYLKDPSLDQCQAYGLLMDCIYDTVVRRCGYDGWEVAFQFLSVSVKNYVQDCTVPRIYRAVS